MPKMPTLLSLAATLAALASPPVASAGALGVLIDWAATLQSPTAAAFPAAFTPKTFPTAAYYAVAPGGQAVPDLSEPNSAGPSSLRGDGGGDSGDALQDGSAPSGGALYYHYVADDAGRGLHAQPTGGGRREPANAIQPVAPPPARTKKAKAGGDALTEEDATHSSESHTAAEGEDGAGIAVAEPTTGNAGNAGNGDGTKSSTKRAAEDDSESGAAGNSPPVAGTGDAGGEAASTNPPTPASLPTHASSSWSSSDTKAGSSSVDKLCAASPVPPTMQGSFNGTVKMFIMSKCPYGQRAAVVS
jgi:hypothetical protein